MSMPGTCRPPPPRPLRLLLTFAVLIISHTAQHTVTTYVYEPRRPAFDPTTKAASKFEGLAMYLHAIGTPPGPRDRRERIGRFEARPESRACLHLVISDRSAIRNRRLPSLPPIAADRWIGALPPLTPCDWALGRSLILQPLRGRK
ncbi:hypothetical protein OH76DRAFT_369107 [Lentinus brumalis]|uniref:Uncharacterized protein n=1 Tax=Lentinus brumalis TaxID=2498619 RepID=A0A371DED5_9APHY|nr:hypothetical protein OH76DRAFT_369107 [Polyporus brumalis]